MTGTESFGLAILLIGLVGTAAVLSNRVSERLRIPAPAFFLVFAAVAATLFPHLGRLSDGTVQRVVTVALAFILFDGGMHIGWRKFRTAATATVWIGVAGTFVTASSTRIPTATSSASTSTTLLTRRTHCSEGKATIATL